MKANHFLEVVTAGDLNCFQFGLFVDSFSFRLSSSEFWICYKWSTSEGQRWNRDRKGLWQYLFYIILNLFYSYLSLLEN